MKFLLRNILRTLAFTSAIISATSSSFTYADERPAIAKMVGGQGINLQEGTSVGIIAIASADGTQFQGHCTGTLVGQREVLTAAHCIDGVNPFAFIINKQAYKVIQTFKHVSYRQGLQPYERFSYDIGMLILEVAPERLPRAPLLRGKNFTPGDTLQVYGYGLSEAIEPDYSGLTFEQFFNAYFSHYAANSKTGQLVLTEVYDGILTAANTNGVSVCPGDSGGPSTVTIDGKPVVAAVTSFADISFGYSSPNFRNEKGQCVPAYGAKSNVIDVQGPKAQAFLAGFAGSLTYVDYPAPTPAPTAVPTIAPTVDSNQEAKKEIAALGKATKKATKLSSLKKIKAAADDLLDEIDFVLEGTEGTLRKKLKAIRKQIAKAKAQKGATAAKKILKKAATQLRKLSN